MVVNSGYSKMILVPPEAKWDQVGFMNIINKNAFLHSSE